MPNNPNIMQIELTNEQYKELATLVCLGSWVRDDVAGIDGEQNTPWENIQKRILFAAINENIPGLAEIFEGQIVPADELSEECEEIMEEFNEFQFFHELTLRLGQRDFYREASKEDIKYIEDHHGLMPEKVHRYYRKYDEEFEKNDIDRLEIKK